MSLVILVRTVILAPLATREQTLPWLEILVLRVTLVRLATRVLVLKAILVQLALKVTRGIKATLVLEKARLVILVSKAILALLAILESRAIRALKAIPELPAIQVSQVIPGLTLPWLEIRA